ncbi:MAG: endonuclease domain-containing protein [Sphingobacteriales bacterium]|nr:MAG: endonuclease domain-containing protein [Sphingobacteriales bacterium]
MVNSPGHCYFDFMKNTSRRRFYRMVAGKLYPITKAFARSNRKSPTAAEELLWEHLRDRKLDGFKFRRQHPTGPYVVDFLCFETKLIVEVDGEIHQQGNHPAQDTRRTKDLEKMGFAVVRFSNEQVLNSIDWVLGEIRKTLHARAKK